MRCEGDTAANQGVTDAILDELAEAPLIAAA
jgi:hypothetical protein